MTVSLGLAFALQITAFAAPSDLPGRHVIRGETIRTAGVVRLSDLALLLEDWETSTVDGVGWDASVRGLAPFGAGSWQIAVDGIDVGLTVLGATTIDRLPVPLARIAWIEVHSVPTLHEGRFVRGGLIDIHTETPPDGVSIGGRLMVGNESGDPGPFRYLSDAAPNQEHIGPDGEAWAAVATRHGFIAGSVGFLEHELADPAIQTRAASFRGAFPEVELSTAAVDMGTQIGRAGLRAFHRRSQGEDYLWLEPLGREIPVDDTYRATGIEATVAVATQDTFEYRLTRVARGVSSGANTQGLRFRWQPVHTTARAWWRRQGDAGPHTIEAGLAWERQQVETDDPVDPTTLDALSAFATITWRPPSGATWGLGTEWTRTPAGVGMALTGDSRLRVDSRHEIALHASVARHQPDDTPDWWYWVEHGLPLADAFGVTTTIRGTRGASTLATADLRWTMGVHRTIDMGLAAYARAGRGFPGPRQRFTYRPADRSFHAPVDLTAAEQFRLAGTEATVHWQPTPRAEFRGVMRYQNLLSADNGVRDLWRAVPTTTFRVSGELRPVPTFGLWFATTFRNAGRWNAYRDVPVQSAGRYADRVPSRWLIHAAADQWLVGRRIRVNLGLRNVLNTTARTHPAGADFDLTVFVQVTARLTVRP